MSESNGIHSRAVPSVVAQKVEQYTCNPMVVGLNPT